ncbi:uncharacterized protein JCM6883_006718 [Sporobolomyces salmoneus]|uniref:uncharacterized protein n=1 Tax=Sporobolomyces salmoneus TaxID=183962 RepID=UPI00316C76FF
MPSLAITAGATALVLALASNVNAHVAVDTQPIHLRANRSNLRRRQAEPTSDATTHSKAPFNTNLESNSNADTSTSSSSTNLFAMAALPPPKQDCTYAAESFNSFKTSQSYKTLLQANLEAASEAIALHKNEPSSVEEGQGTMVKRQSGPNWRWDFGGSTKIRGVNLGGWLVTEPWITPSLFAATGNASVVDEWTFCESLGFNEAKRRLTSHWDTWYTEADLKEIASYGLNTVRIPIGYWAFERQKGEPYVNGQWPYLLKAIGWARKYGLKVHVDVHGAPGSQNGFDNSGRRGTITWQTSQKNVQRTLNVVTKLSQEFAKSKYRDTVTVIQALNEPAGFEPTGKVLEVYRQFAYDSYGRVRYPSGSTPSDVVLSLHDAFQPLSVWEKSFPSPQFEGVALSDHPYFVFNSNDLKKTDQQRISTICGMKENYAQSQRNLWTVLDEFSAATTDCAGSLNGRGIGSRYDGSYPGSTKIGSCTGKTGNGATFSKAYKTSLGKSWAAQTQVWETTSGWISWCFKAENADDWSYQAGVKYGWIPRDLNKPIYPNLCASA